MADFRPLHDCVLPKQMIDGEDRVIVKESDILGVIEGGVRAKRKAA